MYLFRNSLCAFSKCLYMVSLELKGFICYLTKCQIRTLSSRERSVQYPDHTHHSKAIPKLLHYWASVSDVCPALRHWWVNVYCCCYIQNLVNMRRWLTADSMLGQRGKRSFDKHLMYVERLMTEQPMVTSLSQVTLLLLDN